MHPQRIVLATTFEEDLFFVAGEGGEGEGEEDEEGGDFHWGKISVPKSSGWFIV